MDGSSRLHVHGHSSYSKKPPFGASLAAVAIDLAVVASGFCAVFIVLELSPVPRPWLPLSFFAVFTSLWIFQRTAFGRTLGEACWSLRARPGWTRGKLSRGLEARTKQSLETLAVGGFLTIAALAGVSVAANRAFLSHPLFLKGTEWKLEAFAPTASPSALDWSVVPFFYTLGAWPSSYAGKPIFYSLPYEKGPPKRFVGHIQAYWDPPDLRVTIEGPKTPSAQSDRAAYRKCVFSRSVACLYLRESALLRPIREMRKISPSHWDLRWFRIENLALGTEEETQGIYLNAWNDDRGEERFILITPKGVNQAMILDYPMDPAQSGKRLFEKSVRSLRVSDDLGPGRAWIDQSLSSVKLKKLKSEPVSLSLIEKLARVQTLLLSKISVDPQTYASYYHLAGTSLLLLSSVEKGPVSRDTDFSARVKPVVQTLLGLPLFAADVDPLDPRNAEIGNIAIEAKKY